MNVSFIIVAYNEEKNINVALSSISSIKNNKEFEVIIINDASSDKTVDCVEKFQKNFDNIILHNNNENLGRAKSRNKGIENAKGKYVFFVDADDFVSPAYFHSIKDFLDLNHDIIVSNRIDFIIENNKIQAGHHSLKFYLPFFEIDSVLSCPDCFSDNFITGKFYRRDFLLKNGIEFSTARKNAEDILFSTSAWINAKSIRFCREPFYVYGRGNYKKGFSEEKCVDVLVNLSKLKALVDPCGDPELMRIIAGKYANGLIETILRGEGVVKQSAVVKFLEDHFDEDSLLGLEHSDFLTEEASHIIDLMRRGDFDQAVENVLTPSS